MALWTEAQMSLLMTNIFFWATSGAVVQRQNWMFEEYDFASTAAVLLQGWVDMKKGKVITALLLRVKENN